MKIAMFVWEFPPRIVGGLGTYALEISKRFISRGHEVSVFTLNEGNLKTSEEWNGVHVHRPKIVNFLDSMPGVLATPISKWGRGAMFFSNILIYNVLSASKLVNEIVRKLGKEYDLVAAHDWLSIMSGVAIKRELEIPLVFHIHSTEQGRNLGRGSGVIIDLERMGANISDIVVTVSYSMRDELVSLGYPEAKIRVCYNGVDPKKYDPVNVKVEEAKALREKYGVQKDENMILFIGRLVTVKGVDRLVMAMPEVLREFPKTKLVVVGIGEMEDFLRSIIDRLKLKKHVVLECRFLPEKERILHYAACDLAVFPSLYEPFGIVCTEAMSMAKPVVVGARGTNGMKEQVISNGPEQCGVHVNPYDPHDIAWGIKNVLKDPNWAKQVGEKARKRVIENFNWKEATEQTLHIYKEALAKKQ